MPKVAFAALIQHFRVWPGLSRALLVLNCSCVAVSAAASGKDNLGEAQFFRDFLVEQAVSGESG